MKTVVLVTVFAMAMPALAHDLWIVPGRFVLGPGERIRIFINSGDEFPKSASLVGEHRIEGFRMVTARGEESLSGLLADGRSLTVEFSAADSGTVVLALATKSRLVRLKADEFNEYLSEDGLPQILRFREEQDELAQPVVERYSKWAKAIIQVGEQGDETWKEPVGHRIEIVPEIDTYGLQSGGSLPLRVLFEGEPLLGVTVTATRAGGSRNEILGVTDADGRARLRITEAGRWYLRTIHMVRLGEESEMQWESFWATLTFEVRN
jgi:hypothetical protein